MVCVIAIAASAWGQVVRRDSGRGAAGLQVDPIVAIERLQQASPITDGLTITVFDEKDQPVAGASIAAFSNKALLSKESQRTRKELGQKYGMNWLWMMLAFSGRHATRYVTRKDGTVVIPNAESNIIVAVSNRRAATKRSRRGATEIDLEIKPLDEIIVHVIDEEKKPARGIPIAVMNNFFDPSRFGQSSSPIAWTDRDGMAYVPKVISVIATSKIRLGVLFAGKERISQPLNPKEHDGEIIRFEVPAYGQIKVFHYLEDGRPAANVQSASVRLIDPFTVKWSEGTFTAAVVEPNGATFPCVALNHEYEVTLVTTTGENIKTRSQGPTRARELKVLTTTSTEDIATPAISVRLVDTDGKPITNETVSVAFVNPERADVRAMKTDGAGRLKLIIQEHFGDDHNIELYLLRRDRNPAGAQKTFRERPSRSQDLGDIRLEKEPIVLAGTVVDPDGKPLSGVLIEASGMFSRSSRSSSGSRKYTGFSKKTDAQGRFEIRHLSGEIPPFEIRLKGWCLASTLDFGVGDKDVKIVLEQAGSILASVKNPPHDGNIYLRLEGQGEQKHVWIPKSGKITISDLAPGRYSLSLSGDSGALHMVEDLHVKEGEALKDPRVQDLDWMPYIDTLEIEAVDETGQSIKDGEVSLYHQTEGGGWSGTSGVIEKGKPFRHLISKKLSYIAEVKAKGYGRTIIKKAKGKIRAVLKPLIPIPITVRGKLNIPKDARLQVGLEAVRNPNDLPIWNEPRTKVIVDGKATATAENFGKHKLILQVVLARGDGDYQPTSIPVQHHQPEISVTRKTKESGVEVIVNNDLLDSIESMIEQARELRKR